jgi:gluconokinase
VVYLYGEAALIQRRAETRTHEYMPASLLESQFAALEPPAGAIGIDVAATPEDGVAAILPRLPLNPPRRSPGAG